MTDRYITLGGYGDGSGPTNAAPIKDVNNQITQAIAGGGKPRVLLVSSRGPYPFPSKSPGALASDNTSSNGSNDATTLVLDADTSAASSEVVIEGMSDDMVPLEAVLLSDRVRPYTSYNRAHRRYPGQGGIELKTSNVTFRNIKFRDFGLGCVVITTAVSNITWETWPSITSGGASGSRARAA